MYIFGRLQRISKCNNKLLLMLTEKVRFKSMVERIGKNDIHWAYFTWYKGSLVQLVDQHFTATLK